MIPEQQLVQQIVDLIHSDQVERNPVLEEFAEQYAELCFDVVGRLQRCVEYLDRGMRSEAVHEATSAPSLLELVEVIQFDEVRKWGNIVTDLDLAPFPSVPMDIVERLRRECLTEETLAPLLKEYRRCVYQGDQDQCIPLLRELRERDPDNPSWAENLRPLEQDQLPRLLAKAEKALGAGDLRVLRGLLDEMVHPQRLVPIPDEIVTPVKDALMADRRLEAGAQGASLAAGMSQALDEGNMPSLKELLQRWEALCSDEAFRPTTTMTRVVEDARLAHAQAVHKQQAEEALATAISEMRELLGQRRVTSAVLRRHYDALLATGQPLPESLTAAVEETFTRMAVRRRRTMQGAVLLTLVIVALVVAATFTGVQRARTRARRAGQVREMDTLLEQRDYERLQTYIGTIREVDPVLYDSPDVRHLASTVEESLRQKADLDRRLKGVLSQLAIIRDDGYAADEEAIQRLLAEARQVSSDETADHAVDAWQSAWEDWRRRRRRQVNGELERVTALVSRILDDKRQHPFATFADEAAALARVEPLVAEGRKGMEGAGPEETNAFNAVAVQVQGWRREFDERRQAAEETQTRLAQLQRDVAEALPDLALYRTVLQTLVQEFPNEPEVASYQRVLNQMEACIKADFLRSFRLPHLPPGIPGSQDLLRLAAAPELAASVWEDDVRSCVRYLEANEQVRRMIPMLVAGKSDMLRLLVLHYRPKGETEWRRLYHPKPLMSRTEKDDEGRNCVLYWGQIYYYDQDDQVPYLVHSSKVFPDKLITSEYDIRVEPRNQDNLVAHGRFMYRFVAEAAEAPELDVHVLRGIEQLVADEDMENVPKAWLLKRLVHFLEDYFAERVPEAVAMVHVVDELRTEVPWMNPKHPDVIAASAAIEAALPGLPPIEPIITRLQVGRALLAASLSRGVHVVGAVRAGEDGRMVPTFAGPASEAIWILSGVTPDVAPSFKVAGRRSADGSMVYRPDIERELFDGQVLFAPEDTRSSREVLDAVVPAECRGSLQRPSSWPLNAWFGE